MDGKVNIHQIRCSLPIPGATVNLYFSNKPTPTLIDAPPKGTKYLKELNDGLKSLGYSIGDIRRIIITHPHFDHFGSVSQINKMNAAEVWSSKKGARWIEEYETELRDQQTYRTQLLKEAGASAEDIKYVNGYYREANRFGEGAKISRYLEAGDSFELATLVFEVSDVPGHTPGCILMLDAQNGVAFTGDFLTHGYRLEPLVQWTDLTSPAYRTLKSYIGSLRKARTMNLRIAFPGHGMRIEAPAQRITHMLASIASRRGAILEILAKGGQTAFKIMSNVFPGLTREHLFRAISDIKGHLEMLEEDGLIERTDDMPVCFHLVKPQAKNPAQIFGASHLA